MARPTTLSAAKLLLQLGDGASPEVFGAPCGLNTKGIDFTKNTNDVTVPDCDDPDLASWVERVTSSLSAGITGNGVLAKEALDTWREFLENAESQNVRVRLDGVGWGYWKGAFILTAMGIAGDQGNKVMVSITLQSDGEVIWVPTP